MNPLVYQVLAGIAGIALGLWIIATKLDRWLHRRMERRADARAAEVFKNALAAGRARARPLAAPTPDSDLGELSPLVDLERRGENFWRPSPGADFPIPLPPPIRPLTATDADIAAFYENARDRANPPPTRPLTQREQAIVSAGNPRRAAMLREMGAPYVAPNAPFGGRRTPVFHGDPYRKSVIWPMVLPYPIENETDGIDPAILDMLRSKAPPACIALRDEVDPLVFPSDDQKTPDSAPSVDPCPAPSVDLPPDVGNSGDTW